MQENFKLFHYKIPDRQRLAFLACIIFLVIGGLLKVYFNASELVFVPFTVSFAVYGSLVTESKKDPAGILGMYTGSLAEKRGLLYILFGLFFTLFIILRVYLGISR